MLIVTTVIVAKNTNRLNSHQQMNGQTVEYIHRMEYYSAIKRNELLIYATIWVNTENVTINERRQTLTLMHYMIPFK